MERGDDPLAVDEPERVRQAHEDARVDAHPGAIAGQHLVHQVADRGAEVRAVERVDQRRRHRLDEPLVPALLARDLDAGGQQGRDGVGAGQPGQPGAASPVAAGETCSAAQRATARTAASRSAGLMRSAPRARRSAMSKRAISSRDVVLGEHAVAHHGAHPLGHQLPVGRDDRGVGDWQAERMPEERGDREPVGEAAHDAGLGDGQDPAAPPRRRGRGYAATARATAASSTIRASRRWRGRRWDPGAPRPSTGAPTMDLIRPCLAS